MNEQQLDHTKKYFKVGNREVTASFSPYNREIYNRIRGILLSSISEEEIRTLAENTNKEYSVYMMHLDNQTIQCTHSNINRRNE